MSSTRPFLLGAVLSDSSPVLWDLSPGEGWDAVHDSVGINSKKVATTEYQSADVKYMGYGVYVDYVCVF